MNYSRDFNIAADHYWFNCAHQGPMPNCAVSALKNAIRLKEDPSTIADNLFFDIPRELKTVLGALFNVPWKQIILGDSATYILNLLVNGIKWKKGDEILLAQGDFPTNIYPWLVLKEKGVIIKMIPTQTGVISLQQVKKIATSKTRLLCLSWVNSFDGRLIALDEIGQYCKQKDILFVLNGSQAFGYKDLDITDKSYIDVAFGCGFKWLLGPYGTGFGWMKEEVRNSLLLNRYYWLNQFLGTLENLTSYEIHEPENYLDIFNTANFFNYIPWKASLNYLLQIGIQNVQNHNREILEFIIANIIKRNYKMISRESVDDFSSFVVLKVIGEKDVITVQNHLKKKGIFVSLREGNLRITPHIYNNLAQAEYLMNALNY